MFPNIDNELGLGAVKRALETRDHLLPSTSCILEAVEICLKCNHSVFDDKFYLQIHGTAMGPKNACSYADLAMGEIDHKAKFCGPIRPSQWWRYRDDIFDLLQQGLSALNSFTDYINSLYPTIKFELVFSENKLNVLDATLHLVDGFIQTDVCSKPTDSHLYLPPSSAHPRHVFKAIPFGVASRLRRNCSEDAFLTKRLEEYIVFLIFRRNREMSLKSFTISRDFSAEVTSSQKRLVSSANWLILTSFPNIVIPLMSVLWRILFDNISADNVNRYGERGQPCLTPLDNLSKPICCKSIVGHCTLDVGVEYCHPFSKAHSKIERV